MFLIFNSLNIFRLGNYSSIEMMHRTHPHLFSIPLALSQPALRFLTSLISIEPRWSRNLPGKENKARDSFSSLFCEEGLKVKQTLPNHGRQTSSLRIALETTSRQPLTILLLCNAFLLNGVGSDDSLGQDMVESCQMTFLRLSYKKPLFSIFGTPPNHPCSSEENPWLCCEMPYGNPNG